MGGPPPLPAIEGQTYCLRWNNHKANLVEILDALIKCECYVDCTIVVDDQVQFKAHRVVLAANSPYFQSILQDMPMDHCSIIFPGVKAFEMRALLAYMYTGEVNVTQSQIPKIMRIAEELEVKGLFDMADLKEKFNRIGEEHGGERVGNPYAISTGPVTPYSSVATSSLNFPLTSTPQNGAKDHPETAQLNSSSVISTSSNITSSAPTSSSSPPYNAYKSPYPNLYTKSPGPSVPSSVQATTASTAPTPTHTLSQQSGSSERNAQWPISPTAAAAMLSSVYESASDMNPLKRKKLSSLSSMLMNRDTPILRNVLAQSNPADSSQPMPLLLPSAAKNEKSTAEKPPPAMLAPYNNNHSFNGSDYGSEKKYHDEPHSPYTDRSFEEDNFEPKGNFSGNFNSTNSSQKPEWKRYKQYTRNDIMSAIQCVRDGMSALQASRKFGVPSRTLYDKVKKLGITTGRPMNRTMKRSPTNMDTAAFPYAQGFGQGEPMMQGMHEGREEREPKEHTRTDSLSVPPTIPHPLLDHAFLHQALAERGGEMAGREALHAMALAAAAHAAVNSLSTSPGPNGNSARTPSPSYSMKYSRPSEHELHMLEREKERRVLENEMERDHDADDENDHVEDLSLARKDCIAMDTGRPSTPYDSPPPPPQPQSPSSGLSESLAAGSASDNTTGVIVPPMNPNKLTVKSSDEFINESNIKREIVSDEIRAD